MGKIPVTTKIVLYTRLQAPDRCAQLFDRKHFLITDKQTEILDCILCVMVIFLSTRQAEPIYRPLYSVKCIF